MKIKTSDESIIYNIGHAFGYYPDAVEKHDELEKLLRRNAE